MLKDFMTFDKMISPILIKFLFWIGVGMSVLSGTFWILSGLFTFVTGHGLPGLLMSIGGALAMVLGIFWTRVVCEMLIVVFLIHDDLAVIRKSYDGQQMNAAVYAPVYPQMYAPSVAQQPTIQHPNIQS